MRTFHLRDEDLAAIVERAQTARGITPAAELTAPDDGEPLTGIVTPFPAA